MFLRSIRTDNAPTTILIRLMVGTVFLSEGIQKFLFPAIRGAGRFEKIGLPSPETLGPLVGGFEILCGALILLGFLTRWASVPIIVIMTVAMATTKAEIFINEGFWEMMHAARTDFAMFLGSLFLFIKGGGRWSADRQISGSVRKYS